MSEELQARELALDQNERRVELERAGVAFIFDVVDTNGEHLLAAFQITEQDSERRQGMLYDAVQTAVDWIATEHTRSSGVSFRYLNPNDPRISTHKYVRMGWAVYQPIIEGTVTCQSDDDKYPYVLQPTEEGVALVNAYREQLGLVTLDEQRRVNRERFRGILL